MKSQTRQYKLWLIGKGREYEDQHDKKKSENMLLKLKTIVIKK